MAPTKIVLRSVIGCRTVFIALWLRALASPLLASRSADDTIAATYLSTKRWSDQAERDLHSALARQPRQLHSR